MSSSRRPHKRRRHTPHYFGEERRLLQPSSQLDRGLVQVPWAPVFFPSIEDMEGNLVDYVERIRLRAEPYGICKIVPPEGWNPGPCRTCLFCVRWILATTCGVAIHPSNVWMSE